MWIAGKRQRIKRDGGYVEVSPGDPIPEAEHWPNRTAWERQGYIRSVVRLPAEETLPESDKTAETPSESDKTAETPLGPAEAGRKTTGRRRKTTGRGDSGICPHCENNFSQLSKHKCKLAPKE